MNTLTEAAPSPLLQWRAHHILLCSNTFMGHGYTADYTARLTSMLGQINQRPEGMPVRLVDGPDDWCKPLLTGTDAASQLHQKHCLHPSTIARDAMAREDLSQLLGKDIQANAVVLITPAMVKLFRQAFRRATRVKQAAPQQGYTAPRRGCHACSWSHLCDEIAQRHYPSVVLLPHVTTRKIIPIISLGDNNPA